VIHPDASWELGTYEGLRRAQLADEMAATPAQRLEMLEAMIQFVAEVEASRADSVAGPGPTSVRPDPGPPADSSTAE
jgi:hypothetical protein